MGNHDMNHMQHIDAITAADCDVLRDKEATYQGSWKRAGGRSAWFMARRNMDRLLTMLAPKSTPGYMNAANVQSTLAALDNWVHYDHKVTPLPGSIEATRAIIAHLRDGYSAEDIFAKIELAPGGEDGTVLAVLRDLRRYFVLIEAEMMARGTVQVELRPLTYDKVDIYQMIADDKGLTREEVAMRIQRLFYGEIAAPASPEPGPAVGDLNALDVVEAMGGGRTEEELHSAGRNPDNGSQHSSLVPWHVSSGYYEALEIRVGALAASFYSKRALDVWQLEPVVESGKCPRELAGFYDSQYVDGRGLVWFLRRAMVPDDLDDTFPRLQIEMNNKERDGSDYAFQFMYVYEESSQKWKLDSRYFEWGRSAG